MAAARVEDLQSQGGRLALLAGTRPTRGLLDQRAAERALSREAAVLAFVLESLMVAYVPRDLVASVAGDGGFLSILGATLVGIPSYLNGNAALPLVAGLMAKGMAPGAAMAFLVGGGVTSIPAALAVWGVARRAVFAAYLGFATLGAILSGLLFQIAVG